jgi:hypothetical protein
MNEKRTKAFNEWWLLKATPDGRMTPSAIWDAACDWMKQEMLYELKRWTDEEDEGGNGQG